VRRWRTPGAWVAVIVGACLLVGVPGTASAAVWREGTASSPFTLSSNGGLLTLSDSGDPRLTLPYEAEVFSQPSALSVEFDARTIRPASDGGYLVAGGKGNRFFKLSASGAIDRMYGADSSGGTVAVAGFASAFDVLPLEDRGMLLANRAPDNENGYVMRLTEDGQVMWTWGKAGGLGEGELVDPYSVELVDPNNPDGNILIADSKHGNRVIEVNPHEQPTRIIRWYGIKSNDASGTSPLLHPHRVQRLSNGNWLIADAGNNRVVEVQPDTGQEVWHYGVKGVAGSGPGQLDDPNFAVRLPNDQTLICDTNNKRVISVDKGGNIIEEFPGTRTPGFGIPLNDPFGLLRCADGWTLVCDSKNGRIVRYRYKTGREYVATSGAIDPAVGKNKRFTKLSVSATKPQGSSVNVEYNVDGTWEDVPASGTLPSSAKGSAIRYRLRLTAGKADEAPVVKDVAITWNEVTPTSAKNDDGGYVEDPIASVKPKTTKKSGSSGGSSRASGGGSGGSGGAGNGAGGQSNADTAVEPGGTSPINQGARGGLGGPGQSVQAATTMSGWVMNEVQDDATGGLGSAGDNGFANAPKGMGDSTIPGVLLISVAYMLGFAWSPTARLFARAVTMLVAD
jgi:hypothetical protein